VSWQLGALSVLGLVLVAGFGWYERTRPSPKLLALVATLAALAALGRIAFAPLPGVKPTTDIVFIAGFVLGAGPGFAVGATAALASNLVFGQGPWTPWQMVAWGLVGIIGAGWARATGNRMPRWATACVLAFCGILFGAIMNVSHLIASDVTPTASQWLAVQVQGAPFDVAHAVANVLFFLAFGPVLVRLLERYRARLTIDWQPLPATLVTDVNTETTSVTNVQRGAAPETP
jgi:energy-coupling factor transport system substrate-specific component